MRDSADLATLRQDVILLSGEIVLEGWAAKRKDSHGQVSGLVLVTSERLLFVGADGHDLALPIFKIDTLEVIAPDTFAVVIWFGRLQLAFDNPAAAGAALNVLRQDNRWAATEMTTLPVCSDMGSDAIAEAA
ncbi:hypothetical protein [Caulobacter sp. LjRoot300]|uniref:hypothetical protein n=1 Tax=Caulobacter sp. LjRoot300 TaxID=3342321 RepID=UPI003ECF7CDD